MPEKPRTRPLSASRKRRQSKRRSSLNADPRPSETLFYPTSTPLESDAIYSHIDRRSLKEKIENLEQEIKENNDNTTPEEYLNNLVLIQLYTSLEYGEMSTENARACLNLSKFYLERQNLLPQANCHILKARQTLEQLNIKPSKDHLVQNLLGLDVYFMLVKCCFQAKRDKKTKNKHILAIDTSHIDDDLCLIEEYLENLGHLMSSTEYDDKYLDYLLIKFDIIINNIKEYNSNLDDLVTKIIEYMNKSPSNDRTAQIIDLYLRSGSYLINFENTIETGLTYYKKAVELAEEEEKRESCDLHRRQLANAIFQWGKARVKVDRLRESTERKFQRAMELYKQGNDENDKNVLKVIDELATYYTKVENFQSALNILCDSLPDKKRIFGEFSEEVIQTESRIGAIYLRECEYIPAAEHLKECYDLQEFVYGAKDPRTLQTRDALEILKKDPNVARTFFSRTKDGIRQDRPAFRLSNKVSHEKEDHKLLLTVTKKPPMSSRN